MNMKVRTMIGVGLLGLAAISLTGCLGWFTPPVTLVVNIVGSGTVAKNPDQANYPYGTVVQLTATPAPGWAFDGWSGALTGTDNSKSIVLDGSKTVTATFVQSSYTLTIEVAPPVGGTTTPAAGVHTYPAGTVVGIMAAPALGYQFVNWTGDVGTVANPTAAATTITMNGDYTITANFSAASFTLLLGVNPAVGGTTTPPAGAVELHPAGTVVAITATPNPGYKFVNWTGDVGTVANPNASTTTITMNGEYAVTANFIEIPTYTLVIAVSPLGGGTTTPAAGVGHTYPEGTVVDIAATAAVGFAFDKWTGNVGEVADPTAAATTITMNGNYTITANFVP